MICQQENIFSTVSYMNDKFGDSNYDVAFADTARKNNVFMFMVNTKKHGHFKVRYVNYFNSVLYYHFFLYNV